MGRVSGRGWQIGVREKHAGDCQMRKYDFGGDGRGRMMGAGGMVWCERHTGTLETEGWRTARIWLGMENGGREQQGVEGGRLGKAHAPQAGGRRTRTGRQ